MFRKLVLPAAAASAILISITGCGSDMNDGRHNAPTESNGLTSENGSGNAGMMAMCPMQVSGTMVSVSNAPGGVVMSFTSVNGDVTLLRQKVRQMVEMNNMHGDDGSTGMGGVGQPMMGGHGDGMMGGSAGDMMGGSGQGMRDGQHDHMTGGGTQGDGAMLNMVPARASVEDIQNGASLILIPKDASRLEELRGHVRQCAEKASAAQCPMMGNMGHGGDPGGMGGGTGGGGGGHSSHH